MQLIIGNYNYSTWSMRPWLFQDFHNLPIQVERVCLFTDDTRATLDKHFSNQKVPLLIDGDLDIWDSIAILEYLGEKFPETNPWPEDTKRAALPERLVPKCIRALWR